MAERPGIWYIHPYAGGPGVGRYDRAFHLCREFRNRGFDPLIICPSFHHLMDAPQAPGTRFIDGIRHEFLRCPEYSGNGVGRLVNMAAFTVWIMLRARSLAEACGQPALIISSSPHPYAYLAARRVATKYGARCIFEVRDLWPLSLIELAGVSPTQPLVRITGMVERHAYASADAVVSLLPCTRTYMQGLGLDTDRWHYIPNGVTSLNDPAWSADASMDLPEPLQQVRRWRKEGAVIVVYAGALGVPNHVQSLLAAMRLLPHGSSEVRVVIVGRGEMEMELRNAASDPVLADRVLIAGQIPKQLVRNLLASADIGYISLRPEPLFRFGISPNKLFDYMLAGLPVVAAIRAGNDPVGDAGCGLRVDPVDPQAIAAAIRHLADMGSEARRSMGARGRSFVLSKHAYDRLACDYLAIAGLTP